MTNQSTNKPYIIFDFDGTIADSLPLIIQTYQQLAKKYNLTTVTDKELLTWRSKSAREIFRLSGVSVFKVIPLLNEGKQLFRQHIQQVKPIPGIVRALTQLSQTHNLGIITSNSASNVETFLHAYDLKIFKFIYSDNTIFGKADVIKKALKQHRIAPAEAIYVGDEIRDIHAARRSGILCLSVSWGLNSKEALISHRPARIVDNPQELVWVIQANNRNAT